MTGQELALVNSRASIIMINTLINRRMTSLQKDVQLFFYDVPRNRLF